MPFQPACASPSMDHPLECRAIPAGEGSHRPLFAYSGTELDAIAGAGNYYRGIADRFAPYLGSHIMEVGAGIGTFASYLLNAAPSARLRLVEPAANLYPLLQERVRGLDRVRTFNGYLSDLIGQERVDSLVAVNVLEHVPDDTRFLADARAVLNPGGHLLLFVPALPLIFGSLDREFEHFRRYTRTVLRAQLLEQGFVIRKLRYTNLPGVLSWFFAGRVLRQTTIAPRQVEWYDRWVMPWVERFERLSSPPIGQSLIAVAQTSS